MRNLRSGRLQAAGIVAVMGVGGRIEEWGHPDVFQERFSLRQEHWVVKYQPKPLPMSTGLVL
jgi:hypothetical protein